MTSQYQYLDELFPDAKDKKNIDVAWVGIDSKYEFVGGAAGANAFISNYILNDENSDISSDDMLVLVSGHEVFHILSPYSYPLWMSESLAQYYAQKSLRVADQSVTKWSKTCDVGDGTSIRRGETQEIGLYKAHDEVMNKKNHIYYGLFYSKGANFWHDLDCQLQKKGASLDTYLPILFSTEKNGGYFLSETFQVIARDILGSEIHDKLISRYLH